MDAKSTERIVAAAMGWSAERRRSVSLALLGQPPLFDIEVASACNIECTFCPRKDIGRPTRLMDEATFDRVATFLPDGAVVMFSGLGEPLLNPGLERFLARLRARSISACIVTNGLDLVPARQAGLVDAGVAEIQVSVHGLDRREVAPIVRRGAAPERVRAYLEHLARIRPPGLRVRINFVETHENADVREGVATWARSLGFAFHYRRLHGRGGTVASLRSSRYEPGCGIFCAVTFVTVEGDLLACVNDVRGEASLGSVHELDWDAVLARKRDVIARDAWFAPCRTCDDDYRWVILAQHGVDVRDEAPSAVGPAGHGALRRERT